MSYESDNRERKQRQADAITRQAKRTMTMPGPRKRPRAWLPLGSAKPAPKERR